MAVYFILEKGPEKMLLLIQAIIVFVLAFGINIVPFFGPSNIFIAAIAAIDLEKSTFSSILIIGAVVALGATIARMIQYKVTPLISKYLSEKQRANLERNASHIYNRAFFVTFFTAASPIPEEVVIVSLSAVKYNIVKFSIAYFLGKMVITTIGAFAGNKIGGTVANMLSDIFPKWFTPEIAMTIMSTFVAIIIMVILLKVDLGKLKMFRKEKASQSDKCEVLEKN
jgi:membrane protein YqaA with SNARE-associated domain